MDLGSALNTLKNKDAKFVWGQFQDAFCKMNMTIPHPSVLHWAYFPRPFIFCTDESGGFGADLSQNMDGCHQPVAYVSKIGVTKQKRLFLIYELKCFSCVVWY